MIAMINHVLCRISKMIDSFRAVAKGIGLLVAVDGVSTIEFAVIASMLATLAIGMLDFGMGLWQQMEVGNAARAGAEFASINGYNSTGIQNAVTSATSLSSIRTQRLSPAVPGVAIRGERRVDDAKCILPWPPSPPCAITALSPGITRSASVLPLSSSNTIVPGGTRTTTFSAPCPYCSLPRPGSPSISSRT